jgi:WD40 repeat protein
MIAVVRIITTVAVLIGVVLSADADGVGESSPEKVGRVLKFQFADGTVITGRMAATIITFRMSGGSVMKIPVSDVKELTVWLGGGGKLLSKIRAGENVFVGAVTEKQFRIASPYGLVTVKPENVRRISPGAEVSPSKLARWNIDLHDKTRLRCIVISKSFSVQTCVGTLEVPLDQIWTAIFAADGKNVHIKCRGSDRISGTFNPKAIISVNTTKGKADMSIGKIAVMFCRTLMFKGYSSQSVNSLVFLPDGKRLGSLVLSGGFTAPVNIFDKAISKMSDKEMVALLIAVSAIAFSSDGKRMAEGFGDEIVSIWDSVTGKGMLVEHSGEVSCVAFSPDAKLLASGSRDKTIKIWDSATGKERLTLKGHSGAMTFVIFSPDGKTLASASLDKTVRIWDSITGNELQVLKEDSSAASCVAFSPDGKLLASGSSNTTIKIWDSATGKKLLTLRGRSYRVLSMGFSPDGKRLASGGYRLVAPKISLFNGSRAYIALSSEESYIVGGYKGNDNKAYGRTVWDAVTGKELVTRVGVGTRAFSIDDKGRVWGTGDKPAILLDIANPVRFQK